MTEIFKAKELTEIVRLADELASSLRNPATLAELYANLSSDEQGAFWDLVAFHFKDWGGGKGCMQNCEIAHRMTDRAKEHVRNLAEHVRLTEEAA